jgi:hypothetical protein
MPPIKATPITLFLFLTYNYIPFVFIGIYTDIVIFILFFFLFHAWTHMHPGWLRTKYCNGYAYHFMHHYTLRLWCILLYAGRNVPVAELAVGGTSLLHHALFYGCIMRCIMHSWACDALCIALPKPPFYHFLSCIPLGKVLHPMYRPCMHRHHSICTFL